MVSPATNCVREKDSLSIARAKIAPKKDDVEKMTPVRIEPISLNVKRNNRIESYWCYPLSINGLTFSKAILFKVELTPNKTAERIAPT